MIDWLSQLSRQHKAVGRLLPIPSPHRHKAIDRPGRRELEVPSPRPGMHMNSANEFPCPKRFNPKSKLTIMFKNRESSRNTIGISTENATRHVWLSSPVPRLPRKSFGFRTILYSRSDGKEKRNSFIRRIKTDTVVGNATLEDRKVVIITNQMVYQCTQ